MKDINPDVYTVRHSASHVMALAVSRLYKDVKFDIGPAIDDGFYYDFDLPERLTVEDLPKIEEEMKKIIAEDLPFEKFVYTREEAREFLSKSGQTYKLDRLNDIPEGEEITFYRCGDFIDLCKGPHVTSTGKIPAFKLVSISGAYFRGKETNPMLQRIYGVAELSKDALESRLKMIEEAKQRDHRIIGKQMDLFSIDDEVGTGLILWHPKAGRMRVIIEDFWRKHHFNAGYEILYTPHIGRSLLWQRSGHIDFYKQSMYSPMIIDNEEYFIKPMNCPFHIQIYKSELRSYRDLPLRWAELGTVYRYEKSGVLHGLLRVRGFTQDDAHIFCTPEQIESEIENVLKFSIKILKAFGFSEIIAYLATRPDKAVGDEEQWQRAIDSLEKALKVCSMEYKIDEGGGAFYGPKIDLKIKDVLGREWQMTTVQFDFNLPERFDLFFIGQDGKKRRPYMIHRALLGSIERFMGILIEHYAGAFPLWLSPEQVRVMPVTDKNIDYAREICNKLIKRDVRAVVDLRSETLAAKIRRAQIEKVPYMLIVGEKEKENSTVAVRDRSKGDLGSMTIEYFLNYISVSLFPPL